MKRHPFLLAVPATAFVLTASAGCGGESTEKRTGVSAQAVTASSPAAPAPPGASASASASSRRPSARDRAWLIDAHQTNLAEVQAGELARKKGATAAVRSAGAMLVRDHAKLDEEVTRVAGEMGVSLPKTAAPDQKAAAARLENESGTKFDQDFLSTMISGHEQMIAKTRAEETQGSSPQVTALARKALPDLRKHLRTLRNAQTSG